MVSQNPIIVTLVLDGELFCLYISGVTVPVVLLVLGGIFCLYISGVTVPVVLLVLEGGENTIKTAMKAVEENTPVVIIQGSGRAADVIAFTVKYFKNNTSKGFVDNSQTAVASWDLVMPTISLCVRLCISLCNTIGGGGVLLC